MVAAATSNPQVQLALDIGTRKVLGIMFEPVAKGGIRIVATARREHENRAMKDGQIHDIKAVARVTRAVLDDLAAKSGQVVNKAYVAAAGRSLLTSRGRSQGHPSSCLRSSGHRGEITEDDVRQLEWEAVAAAQAAAATLRTGSDAPGSGYYCVGYSVTRSWLDGTPISSLAGHIGNCLELEVVATFLPRGVVDALEAVLNHIGLEPAGLTLEPIAAFEAVVPDTMRHLNLALIDIGAGTSDIAIAADGAVLGYAMSPQAGDAVTEFLAKKLMLDFNVAERAKRRAASGQRVRVETVFGQVVEIGPDELRELTRPLVMELAERIAGAVTEINGGPPQAVLLVGGGSQTPGLPEALAELFGLAPQLVAVRGRDAVRGVKGGRALRGPEVVTPLGIALLASRSGGMPLVRVQVDDRWVRLFQPGRLTVGEALRAAGVPRAAVVGKPGAGITVTVNGTVRVFPGERGKPGTVYLDGVPVTLDTPCKDMCRIAWEPAVDGKPARPTVADVLGPEHWLPVIINGKATLVPPVIKVNGVPATPDHALSDRDTVEISRCSTVADLGAALNIRSLAPAQPVRISVNGRQKPVLIPVGVMVDGKPATDETPVSPNSQVNFTSAPLTIRDAVRAAGATLPTAVPVTVNGKEITIDPPVICRRNGVEAKLDDLVVPGDEVEISLTEDWRPMLNAVLPYVEDVLQYRSGQLLLAVDGAPATFTTPLYPGARVTVEWANQGVG